MRRRIITGVIIAAVVVIAASYAVVHYTGPMGVVQSYVRNVLINGDANAAYAALCHKVQTEFSKDQMQTVINDAKQEGQSEDFAQITYYMEDENFFGSAHVQVSGPQTNSIQGQRQVATTTVEVTLDSTFVGWCIATEP